MQRNLLTAFMQLLWSLESVGKVPFKCFFCASGRGIKDLFHARESLSGEIVSENFKISEMYLLPKPLRTNYSSDDFYARLRGLIYFLCLLNI